VRRALLLVGILLTALPPASASATTLVGPDGSPAPQQYRTWLAQAQVPTPPGTVTISLAPCPNGPAWAGGCADMQAHEIYLGPAARNKARFFHELGHIFDATVMSEAQRTKFESLVNRPGVWAGAASSDPAMEKFAEAYSMCARHTTARAMQFGMYGYLPTPKMHKSACAIIKSAPLAPANLRTAPQGFGS
jgi:hypothetical protein